MIECFCACLILWLARSDNTQFMTNSSGLMVIWWPVLKYSVSTKVQLQVKSCYSKGKWLSTEDSRTLLQDTKGLCCNSPTETCQRFHIGSLDALTLQEPLDLLGRMAQVVDLAYQPGPVADPSLVLDSTQN